MHSAKKIYNYMILFIYLFLTPFLPLTPDCSWVDFESSIDTDRALMEGKNASNVDVSLLRKLR